MDCENINQRIKDTFKKEFWEHKKANIHFRSRLIALDKAFPKIPEQNQYRPIVVTSPIIKILEAYLIKDLKEYGREKLDPC